MIVLLTGAGISRESGLSTFRDADGIWTSVPIDEVATPAAFARDPARVHGFYNARRRKLLSSDVAPNQAHLALARLQRARADVLLVTQNVDNLHERAGSPEVLHMHGELLKARCLGCGTTVPWIEEISVGSRCPACDDAGRLRVAVVWFHEQPLYLEEIVAALEECSLFVAIGTSGSVYPAAGFVERVACPSVEINLAPSAIAAHFSEGIYGPASETVPAFVDRLLAGQGGR
ncbi:MAG: NAD-dependent deacetylase [Rhodospirillaceae bacterium]|jgi:NAD-dependent deacetylase|nr:NAD-dependent deacetylase [Rhodospirillaceae bacterium]